MSAAYRADHVGSFLRPAEVKEARAAYREGRLSPEQLRHIEDRAILAVVERQRSIGVDIFTDGELRRSGFQNDLLETVEGFVATASPAVVRIWQGPGGEPQEQGTRQVVGGKLRQVRRLTFDGACAPSTRVFSSACRRGGRLKRICRGATGSPRGWSTGKLEHRQDVKGKSAGSSVMEDPAGE